MLNDRLLTFIEEKKFSDAHELLTSCSCSKTKTLLLTTVDDLDCVPLHAAIWNGAPDDLLLELIAADEQTLEHKNKYKDTPLHLAARCGVSFPVMHALISRRPLVLEERNSAGKTPREENLSKLSERSKQLVKTPAVAYVQESRVEALEECEMLRRLLDNRDKTIAHMVDTFRCQRGQQTAESDRIRELEKKVQEVQRECAKLKQMLAERESTIAEMRRGGGGAGS